jgi:hypothetical protein
MMKSGKLRTEVVEKNAISSCTTRSMLKATKLRNEVVERKSKFCGGLEGNGTLLRSTTRLKSEKLRSEVVGNKLVSSCITRSMTAKSAKKVMSHRNKWSSTNKWRKNSDTHEWRNKSKITNNYEMGVKACKVRASIATKKFIKSLPRLNRWEKSHQISKEFRIRAIAATKSLTRSIPRIYVRQNKGEKNLEEFESRNFIKSFKLRAMTATKKFTKAIPIFEHESFKLSATNAARNFVKLTPKVIFLGENSKKNRALCKKRKIMKSLNMDAKAATKKFVKSITRKNVRREDENLNRNMYDVPPPKLLLGHDTSAHILKSIMLFWESSGRGNYANISNILINEDVQNEENSQSVKCIEKDLKEEKLTMIEQSKIIKKI